MDMNTYQRDALRTDRVPADGEGEGDLEPALIVPMLGLAGETGQLLSEYKKHLRDGDAHRLFKERVAEELGDLLWYIANVASKFGLSLGHIASKNLEKVSGRWMDTASGPLVFDEGFPEGERLPRRFEVELQEAELEGRRCVHVWVNGVRFGDRLTDNSYDSDGYRFHDVFHFAYACVLGWSPVIRKLLKCKRKSNPLLDEVEDGGRAGVIEEGVAALAFTYAQQHRFLDGVSAIDSHLLQTIKSMTAHLEVGRCTTGEWEQAILQGFRVWREVVEHSGGRIAVDLDQRCIEYAGLPQADAQADAPGARPS